MTAIAPDSNCDSDVDTDIRPDGEDSLNQDYYDLSQGGSCSNEAAQVTKALENPSVTSPFVGVDTFGKIVRSDDSFGKKLGRIRNITSVGNNTSMQPSLSSGPLL